MVYDPALKLSRSSVFSPLSHEYVISPAPPVVVTSIPPSLSPLHVTPYPKYAMWLGFIFAAYAAIANDSIQTIGPFIDYNQKKHIHMRLIQYLQKDHS